MAEFQEIMKTRFRMCSQLICIGDPKGTNSCPLRVTANGKNIYCKDFLLKYPKEAEEIILKWDKEHPVKTRSTDFFEKNPNAMKRPSGIPRACAEHMGYCDGCPDSDDDFETHCDKCWNTPLEE